MLSIGKAEFQYKELNREWTRLPKPCLGNLFYIDTNDQKYYQVRVYVFYFNYHMSLVRAKSVEFLYGVTSVIFLVIPTITYT